MSETLLPTSTATAVGDAAQDDQRVALSAPVADPFWLLARQWQTGAFLATDGGSPVRTSVAWSNGPVSVGGAPVDGPLDGSIEAERLPIPAQLTTARRVRMAAELQRHLRSAGVDEPSLTRLRADWLKAYPFPARADGTALGPAAARLPDPVPLVQILQRALTADGAGTVPDLPGLADLDAATADAAHRGIGGWYRWAATLVAAPTGRLTRPQRLAPPSWDATRLVYRTSCAADLATGSVALTSTDYDGAGLDWSSFDRSALTATPAGVTPTVTTGSLDVHPGRVSYAGMPRPRWWELEDGDVNLDALRAGDDPARAVLAGFAHSYCNDWFLCPLDLTPGWAQVDTLTVTDTFGTVTEVVPVAALDGDAGPWRMWDLSRADGAPDAAAGMRLVWPVSPPPLDGPVLEEILLARDEMANLAWIVELQTQDGDGATVDRYRRYLELRPDDAAAGGSATATPDSLSYRLGTSLPDFWYPLATTGDPGAQVLQLASLPPEASGVPDTGVRGVAVAHDASTALAASVVSRQGRRVVRRNRLVVGPGGVRTWRVRTVAPGAGDASSGLRFDVLG